MASRRPLPAASAEPTPTRQRRPPGRRHLGRRGASPLEFAVVAVPATLMMYGVMEASWQVATLAALDHAALRAARFGATGMNRAPGSVEGAPACRTATIPWLARQVTGGLLKPDRLTITTTNFANFNSAHSRTGGTPGAGIGGQTATYQLTYRQPWLVGGLVKFVTGLDAMTYSSTITIRNEPFENEPC